MARLGRSSLWTAPLPLSTALPPAGVVTSLSCMFTRPWLSVVPRYGLDVSAAAASGTWLVPLKKSCRPSRPGKLVSMVIIDADECSVRKTRKL